MVYRITRVSSNTARKTVFISFFTKWCIYAFICYVLFGLNEASPLYHYSEWLMLSMALPAALVAVLEYRRIRQNIKTYENYFYTLTEGGLLIESDRGKASVYISWADITEAQRVLRHTVFLRHKNGKSMNCLLEGLPEQRIAEFADFAAKHAGTTPAVSELTPPPAELMSTEPLRFSASPEQRRELADTRALLAGRRWVWTWICPILLMLWGVFFVYYAGEAKYINLLIIAFFIWKYAVKLWRPGGAAEHLRYIQPSRLYSKGAQLLGITDNSSSWVLNRQCAPRANYIMPHGTCVDDTESVFMIDPEQPLPAQLQAPCKQLPALMPRTVIAAILVAILIGSLYTFTLSNTWRLHRVLSQPTPDIPTALSLAQLPPTTEVTDATAHSDEQVSILLHSIPEDYRYAAILSFELANGDMIYAFFDRYAQLVGRNVIPNAIDSDAAEYEEEAAASECDSQDVEP